MAQSKFEYVKKFELEDRLVPNCWIVVRIDGKAFHKFSSQHNFQKPNDVRALSLMNACATEVMKEFPDVMFSFGQSDEYSFVLRKDSGMYGRRSAKIMTNIVSLFASNFVFRWNQYFPTQSMQYPPSFDARTVVYPSEQNLRDYMSWRQADCHINNLYNTVFWALVLKGGLSNRDAQEKLKGTFSSDKNEILFTDFGINYNNEPEQFRKGTTLFRKKVEMPVEEPKDVELKADTTNEDTGAEERKRKRKEYGSKFKIRTIIQETTCDIIGDQFWNDHPNLLNAREIPA